VVEITNASFDTLTKTLTVNAISSDKTVPPPALVVLGPAGGPMIGGAYSLVIPSGIAPHSVAVQSSAGDSHRDEVAILPGLPANKPFPPVAVADAITTLEGSAVAADVTANDAVTPPAGVSQVLVVTPPLNGTAVAAATGGVVTYTPATLFFGTDSFDYVLVDTLGNVSNVATATITVNFFAVGPTAKDDNFALIQNSPPAVSSRIFSVIANDVAAPGTVIDPASVSIVTLPLHGTAVVNPNGTVTYTPVDKYVGVDSYQYTVKNTAGNGSNVATVSIVVEGGPEIVSFSKVNYSVGKAKWVIVGSTNWFGPTLTPTATCYIGKTTAGAVLDTAPVVLGKFAVVPLAAPPPDATNLVTCQTSNGGIASAPVSILP
jgi:Bacterial Ig domain